MINKNVLLTFLNEPKLILLHTVKWFQVLLFITNNSIKQQSIVYSQLNDQTVLFQTIRFSITHLFVDSMVQETRVQSQFESYQSGAIQRMEYHPPLHLGVVAKEKGAFGSLSTKSANFFFL